MRGARPEAEPEQEPGELAAGDWDWRGPGRSMLRGVFSKSGRSAGLSLPLSSFRFKSLSLLLPKALFKAVSVRLRESKNDLDFRRKYGILLGCCSGPSRGRLDSPKMLSSER
mmetsp:Transcript_24117/g.42038  ORF Transcript_24117/g.42038 Transcript_24117/m.42038 type:complete len:112 (-) Transcript_24117:167-502(-)